MHLFLARNNMLNKLIQAIEEGTPEERDNAAREICQRRLVELESDLLLLLDHNDEAAREVVVVVLGVLGQQKSMERMTEVAKEDMSTNVRVAAIIAHEYAGKITYDHLWAQIKRFKAQSQVQKDDKATEQPESAKVRETRVPRKRPDVVRISDLEKMAESDKKPFVPYVFRYIDEHRKAVLAVLAAGVIIVSFILFGERDEGVMTHSSPQGSGLVANRIMGRIAAISEFKQVWLDPESPQSRYPMTLELRSMIGDTYGSLFEKVYMNVLPTEEGMNTLGAFWRHINFGPGRKQNDVTLMDQETSGELLLFPNLAGINLMLKAGEEDVAFQHLFQNDPDLEISIEVDGVEIR